MPHRLHLPSGMVLQGQVSSLFLTRLERDKPPAMGLVLHHLGRFCGQRMADRITAAQWLDYPAPRRFENVASIAIVDCGQEILAAATGSVERGISFCTATTHSLYVSKPDLTRLDPMCRHRHISCVPRKFHGSDWPMYALSLSSASKTLNHHTTASWVWALALARKLVHINQTPRKKQRAGLWLFLSPARSKEALPMTLDQTCQNPTTCSSDKASFLI